MCMCRSTSISGRERSRARKRRSPRAVVAPARPARCRSLPARRPPGPSCSCVGEPRGPPPRCAAAAPGRRSAAVEVGGERLDLAGLEHEPALAVGQHLLVDGQARGDRRPRRRRAPRTSVPGVARIPVGGEHGDVGAAERLGLARRPQLAEADAFAQRAAERRRRRGRPRGPDLGAPGQSSAGSARSARRNVRTAARSSPAIITSSTAPSARRALGARIGAGGDHLVLGRGR